MRRAVFFYFRGGRSEAHSTGLRALQCWRVYGVFNGHLLASCLPDTFAVRLVVDRTQCCRCVRSLALKPDISNFGEDCTVAEISTISLVSLWCCRVFLPPYGCKMHRPRPIFDQRIATLRRVCSAQREILCQFPAGLARFTPFWACCAVFVVFLAGGLGDVVTAATTLESTGRRSLCQKD